MTLIAAVTRDDVARYVSDLFGVYIVLLLIYLIANLILSFGARPPYSRAFDAVMNQCGHALLMIQHRLTDLELMRSGGGIAAG